MSRDLKTLLRDAAPSPTTTIDEGRLVDKALRQMRLMHAGGIAAVLLLVAAGVLLTVQALGGPGDVEIVGQPSDATGSGWQQMPSNPVDGRVFPTVVWADDRLLVWGGEKPSEGQWHDTGAVFDPAAMIWTEISDAPISARSEHAAVWTGQEMIVCCGRVRGETGAAAYDPDSDQWRTISTSPLANVEFPLAVWTGEEMIVTGGVTGGGTGENRTTAAYDPDIDKWRALPDVPDVPGGDLGNTAAAVWTGDRMIVWPSSGPHGLALDPAAEQWTQLPQLPEDVRPRGASLVWTGKEVLVVGSRAGLSEELVAAAYQPDSNSWRTLDPGLPLAEGSEGNFGSQAAVWTGNRMLVWTGYLGSGVTADGSVIVAYDPTDDSWDQLPTAPRLMWRPEVAWTGSQLIAIGQEANLILTPDQGPTDDRTAEAGNPPPPEPQPSPTVDVDAYFADLPAPDVPEGSALAGGGPRIEGRGILLPPAGPLHLSVPDAAHDTDGTLTFTVWLVDDQGNRIEQVHTEQANAGPQGADAIEVPVRTQEETKYEIRGELQQDDGDEVAWRDWAVVVPQIPSASLEITSDRPVNPGQEFQVAVRNHGTVTVGHGLPYELSRWNGNRWIPVEQELGPWNSIGFSVPPGQIGETQTITAPSRPGHYRLSKEISVDVDLDNQNLRVTAQFTVEDRPSRP
ncbi:MAG: hypothetical protein M3O70_02915 [Actinomycetota bacterium]|nr:hypothetical protein [Actinomycetota bacterium]